MIFLVQWFLMGQSHADYYDTDVVKSQAQVHEIRESQKEDERGYVYDTLQRDKELIFKQLEVITGDEETRYIIVPGDTLSIVYTDKDKKNGALYMVSDKGEIFLPFVGAVKVEGLNRQQAALLVNQKLAGYIRYPNVEMTVNAAGRIMVLGEVNLPGLYYTQPNLTVMEAIMKAGGYDQENAGLKSIILIRGAAGKGNVKRLNLLKMITKGDRSDDVMVKPGDLIYVPKTFIADLVKFKDEVYKWVSTYYSFGRLPAPPRQEPSQPIWWGKPKED
ncbi:MAG: polysaccharide export protein [Candidatus Omnitrophica bacterium]|nr:polysaccharide export protein [Candidatus Omnitrophota bacterium]